MRHFTDKLIGFLFVVLCAGSLPQARPQPNEIFREYIYPSSFLRVGGRLDYGGGNLPWYNIDLTNATKAEVSCGKLLCHDNTRGLAIQINGKSWRTFPEAPGIPSPQYQYQHMIYPQVSVPLSDLVSGNNNFRLRVDESFGWWPQNLIYGVVLRVYYSSSKTHPTGSITKPTASSTIGKLVDLECTASPGDTTIRRVEYVGYYEDFNYEGDNIYRQWHYVFLSKDLKYHIGTATDPPYKVTWNASWVPSQTAPIRVYARIMDNSGLVYTTPSVDNLTLNRGTLKVEMYKPYNVPTLWVTRKGKKTCSFNVPSTSTLATATAAKMIWVSWCPCYANGIGINNVVVTTGQGTPCYAYYYHDVPTPKNIIKNGVNTIFADGSVSNEHGMEVNWPGIVVKMAFGQDIMAPVLLSASAINPTTVRVVFDEPVDQAAAEDTANYYLSYGANVLQAVREADQKTITLTTTTISEGRRYMLRIYNMKDVHNNPVEEDYLRTYFEIISGDWIEDFNDGVANNWSTGGGSWSVSNGQYTNSGSGRMASWGGTSAWTDITYTCDVKPVSSTDVWVIFRVQDASNYYLFTLQTAKLYKLQNGTFTELKAGTGTFSTGTTYKIKVELSGSTIRIYNGTTLVLSHTDNTFGSGKVGFGGNSATGVFDNAAVTVAGAEITALPSVHRPNLDRINITPNPFLNSTSINFNLNSQPDLQVRIFNHAGQEMEVFETPPASSIQWNAGNLPGGIYLLQVDTGQEQIHHTLIKLVQ